MQPEDVPRISDATPRLRRAAHLQLRCFKGMYVMHLERFAAKAGMDRTYYAGIERGERNPSVKNLAKIAVALGVPLRALFDEDSLPAG